MRLASHSPAHLAGEPVAVQDKRPCFLGNCAFKGWLRLWVLQQVLAGLEVAAVVVGQDEVAFLRPQLPHPACPLGDAAGHVPQFFGVHHPTQVRQEMRAEPGPCAAARVFHACAHPALLSILLAALSRAADICWPTALATGGGKALPTCL